MENNSNFWWLHTPHSSSIIEIEDLPYSTTRDNWRNYLDVIFFPSDEYLDDKHMKG
jgi:hypothetical protein